jgi:hypothetical protein
MDLFNSFLHSNDEPDHWVMLDQSYPPVDLIPLDSFRKKLDKSLSDLGRLDYSLKQSLDALRTGLTMETHDHLHARVSELVEPDLAKAMSQLAEALEKARSLTDEVIADGSVGSRQ